MSEKVYVAASFEQRDEVRDLYARVIEAGHTITADWTTHKEIVSLESPEEREKLKQQYAIEDTNGVLEASVYCLLLKDRKSTGAHIELGIALGAHVELICIVGNVDESQLFYSHPDIIKVPDTNSFLALLSQRI